MPTFIDDTYFIGSLKLSKDTFKIELLNVIIDRVEEDILIKALGYDLYKTFIAELSGTPDQKWLDLRDGADFTVQDSEGRTVTVRWDGLKNAKKVSLLAYFAYFEYMQATYSVNTMAGNVLPKGENSNKANISQQRYKMINAYEKGVQLYGKDLDLVTGKNVLLRNKRYMQNLDYEKAYKYYYEEILKGSLYNFIYFKNDQNGDDYYPNWNFTEIESINTFGI